MVLFIIQFKVVLTFESMDEILKCDHSNETSLACSPEVLFIMQFKVVLSFELVRDEILKRDHSNKGV